MTLSLYLDEGIKNERGHTLLFVVLLKQDFHHRVPETTHKNMNTTHKTPVKKSAITEILRLSASSAELPDRSFDVQDFLSVQRISDVRRRSRTLQKCSDEGFQKCSNMFLTAETCLQKHWSLTSAVPSMLNLASWILRPLCRSLTKPVRTEERKETIRH